MGESIEGNDNRLQLKINECLNESVDRIVKIDYK